MAKRLEEINLSWTDEHIGMVLGMPLAELMKVALTVPSAAARLGVERQRVYQLIDEGTLKGYRLVDREGDLIKVIVSYTSVEAYLDYRNRKAAVAKPAFA